MDENLAPIDRELMMTAHRIVIGYAVNDESFLSDAVRDEGTLEHIIDRTMRCENAFDRAASLLWSISNWHPFMEGNKRTAWLMMQYALHNCYLVTEGRDEDYNFYVRETASGMHSGKEVAVFIRENAVGIMQDISGFSPEARLKVYADMHSGLLKKLSERFSAMSNGYRMRSDSSDIRPHNTVIFPHRCRPFRPLRNLGCPSGRMRG
jgi:death-on-curing protein